MDPPVHAVSRPALPWGMASLPAAAVLSIAAVEALRRIWARGGTPAGARLGEEGA
jgi:hypothetical protein